MIEKNKIKDLVLVSLVADSYSLGTHWVYDEKQLLKDNINWQVLNTPMAIWHKGKKAGEFTHYGDQTIWLYEYLIDKEKFNASDFSIYWYEKMKIYDGYIDGASKQSMQNVVNGVFPSGSFSTDLSIVGRITPLLMVSSNKEEFLENVESFVRVTHNSSKAISSSKFFAKLLLMLLNNKDIESSIEFLKEEVDSSLQKMIQKGLDSKNSNTYETIRDFGPACDIDEGFSSVIHLLVKYSSLKEMLIQNAKAGGDTSARAMISSILLIANKNISQIPQNWLEIKTQI